MFKYFLVIVYLSILICKSRNVSKKMIVKVIENKKNKKKLLLYV